MWGVGGPNLYVAVALSTMVPLVCSPWCRYCILFAFESLEDMDRPNRDTDGPDKIDPKLSYTGGKNEDRVAFVRRFVELVGRVQRAHESKIRRQTKTAAFQGLSAEQKQALRDSQPDYRSIWDLLPSFLAGEDHATSPAHEWWCAAYLKDGIIMASNAFRILKDVSERDSFQGSVRSLLHWVSRRANVPQDFHKNRKNSKYENEVKNAKMREYTIKHLFPKHKMGITTEEWLKLPEAEQQQVAASAEARSDDGGDEAEYDSNFNEREEYSADERVDPAGEGVVTSNHSEESSTPGLQARAAIALGNTQKMQGFPVKTPEEFDKDAQIAAMLLAQRAMDLPKDIDNLLALEEIDRVRVVSFSQNVLRKMISSSSSNGIFLCPDVDRTRYWAHVNRYGVPKALHVISQLCIRVSTFNIIRISHWLIDNQYFRISPVRAQSTRRNRHHGSSNLKGSLVQHPRCLLFQFERSCRNVTLHLNLPFKKSICALG
ncbi:hypothetical protein CYMTET_10187 [Cymbomonas tetramitiformis]|uniref:Uncharacterized protein n=1 Tax=Cymbomonas tetramitiformis TaxID=36881 RepID=A0AAE0GPM5_9CHLO|nr:hypothetical protein CYMTET_10187 [Cymbomonas tetramitiformis]